MKIKCSAFKTFLESISRIDGEPCIKADKTGLLNISVDPAHVSIVKAFIPISDALTMDGEDTTYCISSEKTLKFLKSIKPNDSINVEIDNGRMRISGGNFKFATALIEGKSPPKVPNLKLDGTGEILVKDLKSIINSNISDNVKFVLDDKALKITVEQEGDDMSVSYPASSTTHISASYPSDYLSNALIGETLKVEFGNDHPMKIYPQIENMELMYLVAPRIERE